MFRRNGNIGRAVQRVGARREYFQHRITGLMFCVVRKMNLATFALADPIRLHGLHALGPAGQCVERLQQLVGILGDIHVVHRNLALFHQRAGAPAAAVDHLLVREHGLIDRIPIHLAGLEIDEALLQHAQEKPLIPLVVIGAAGCQLALPIDRKAERLQLLLHVFDVVVGPLCRRDFVFHRRVFRRQTERVPTHGLQYVETAHAMEATQHIADGVVAHMTHM